jgi:hypothetical protein
METFKPGYHMQPIQKGKLGEISKIEEELAELKDAIAQQSSIMAILELSDLIGAIEHYLAKHHVGTTLDDLIKMAKITARAFKNGARI